jgi:hypothetical protein
MEYFWVQVFYCTVDNWGGGQVLVLLAMVSETSASPQREWTCGRFCNNMPPTTPIFVFLTLLAMVLPSLV